jgi:protein ImuB
VAAGEGAQVGRATLGGRALAVAPLAGGERGAAAPSSARLGEVSQGAEAHGVRRGMALGEALARCPELVLVPADPVRVCEEWEGVFQALEGIKWSTARPGSPTSRAQGRSAIHGRRRRGARAAILRPDADHAAPRASAPGVRPGCARWPLVLDGERKMAG